MTHWRAEQASKDSAEATATPLKHLSAPSHRALQIARRILRQEADAADAVQDAFISAMASIHNFRADSQLSTWFHRVATNAALMKHRARLRRDVRNINDLAPSFYPDGHRIGPKPAWSQAPDEILEKTAS